MIFIIIPGECDYEGARRIAARVRAAAPAATLAWEQARYKQIDTTHSRIYRRPHHAPSTHNQSHDIAHTVGLLNWMDVMSVDTALAEWMSVKRGVKTASKVHPNRQLRAAAQLMVLRHWLAGSRFA